MEFQREQSGIFDLTLDGESRASLTEAARWGKFLAIVGFVGMALMLLVGILMLTFFSAAAGINGMFGGGAMLFIYLIVAGLYFYPVYALYKFSVLIKPAISTANQGQFNEALAFLKGMFKYMGILTLIVLAFYGLLLIFGIFSAMF